MLKPASLEELQDVVRSQDHLRVCGAGTKPAMSRGASVSTAAMSGILEYEPSEFTFTALAGTPLRDIQSALAANGQFLAFDPPLVEAGATLGGTTAAGLSGPGRFRYGGLRDFLLGVKLVTGEGRVVFGGGKVVKNAAGFDIPKLVAGSLGRLGVLVELTFKVFPAPQAWTTIRADYADVSAAETALVRLAMSQEELMCLDLSLPGSVWMRLGGLADAQPARIDRVRRLLEGAAKIDVLRGDDDARTWKDAREFRWVPTGSRLVRMPISPGQVVAVHQTLAAQLQPVAHRFSVGGNVVWIAWPDALPETEICHLCEKLGRPAVALTGDWSGRSLGPDRNNAFLERLANVFDPTSRLARV